MSLCDTGDNRHVDQGRESYGFFCWFIPCMPKQYFKIGLWRVDQLTFQTNAHIYFVSEMQMKMRSPDPQIHLPLFQKHIPFSFYMSTWGHASPTGTLEGEADRARGRPRLRTLGEQGSHSEVLEAFLRREEIKWQLTRRMWKVTCEHTLLKLWCGGRWGGVTGFLETRLLIRHQCPWPTNLFAFRGGSGSPRREEEKKYSDGRVLWRKWGRRGLAPGSGRYLVKRPFPRCGYRSFKKCNLKILI